MTAGAHSAHRSRKWWTRRGMTRAAAIRHCSEQAEEASFQATFCGFASVVAEQRHDVVRARSYSADAVTWRKEAAHWRRAAEQCRPWWQRRRRAFREWNRGNASRLLASWSWRTDDPAPRR